MTTALEVAYDAGVLIGADRGDLQIWQDHRVRLEQGILPLVPAPVVAQVSRSPKQHLLRRFLGGCKIVPFAAAEAHAVGALAGAAGTADVVDAHLVAVAGAARAVVLTADARDLERLAEHLLPRPRVVPV